MFKRPIPYGHVDQGTYDLGDLPRHEALNMLSPPSPQVNQMPLEETEPLFDPNFDDKTLSTIPHSAWKSNPVDKLLLIAACIIPLLASTSILVATIMDRRSTGPLLSFVSGNRATAQIIVSIVSAVLAALNVYTVTKLLNLATRIHLLRQSLSLDMIKFIGAVATGRSVTSLPLTMSATTMIIVLLFAIPNVLWTGALTPVLTRDTVVEASMLKIPLYSTSANTTWSLNQGLSQVNCTTVTDTKGIFSDCPLNVIHSSLVSRAAQASSNLSYSKIGNSQYSYVGRSYGVGSSAGIVDENLYSGHRSSNILSYNYTEPGYHTSVACFHNASSDWHLEMIQEGKPGNGIPYIYYAIGLFPNQNPGGGLDFFSAVGMNGDSTIAALSAKRHEDRNVILITAGSNYPVLNGTQCEVIFMPTEFTVNVDAANKLISVLPMLTKAANLSFDPTIGLQSAAIDQLNSFGGMSTTLYTSVIGDALMSNIGATTNDTSTSSSPSSGTPFSAMDDSFSTILDELLLFIGSSQFFLPNAGAGDYSTVDACLTVQAVRLGEAKYVFPTFAICVLLLVAVIFEACRTSIWKWLPEWDFTDTACVVFASAAAGKDILLEMCQNGEGRQMGWTGAGSGGWWMKRRSGGRQEKIPTKMPLRLGRKEIKFPVTEQTRYGDRDGDVMRRREVKLTTVSLWPGGASGVVPLA